MKVAILGVTGQVGHAVFRAARRREGVSPVAVGRDAVDLDDLEGIEPGLAALDFDVLVNCAGYTDVDGAESERDAAYRRNAHAVGRIAAACARKRSRLVQLSTDYVFDGESGRAYGPDDATAPVNVYGASKLEGERLALTEHVGGTMIVRTSSVYGLAGRREGKGNFVETILGLSGERDRLDVVSDVTMAPTYAADLAEALLSLVEAGVEAGIYHVTNAGRATWHEFAEAIVRESGGTATVDGVPAADYPSAARRPRFSVLDTGKAEALVGRRAPWEDALGRYLAERRAAASASADS